MPASVSVRRCGWNKGSIQQSLILLKMKCNQFQQRMQDITGLSVVASLCDGLLRKTQSTVFRYIFQSLFFLRIGTWYSTIEYLRIGQCTKTYSKTSLRTHSRHRMFKSTCMPLMSQQFATAIFYILKTACCRFYPFIVTINVWIYYGTIGTCIIAAIKPVCHVWEKLESPPYDCYQSLTLETPSKKTKISSLKREHPGITPCKM